MTTPGDLNQIWQWNALVPDGVHECAHVTIQERIDLQPNAPAVCAWDGALTYAELGRLAADLACRLIHLGLDAPGAYPIVPLCFEKSMWTAIAMLGVLKAGAGFVLIDPQQPEHRLRTIVKQVEAQVIISSPIYSRLASRLAPKSIVLSSQLFETPKGSTGSSLSIPDPSAVAYIAFTSGSTGEPKGALISHRNVSSALHHQRQRMRFNTTTRFYDFSSYSFDASIGVFFTTLEAGGCICVPSEADRRENLIESILSLNANTVDLTPSVAALLSPSLVPCLNTLILGGEALQVRDVERWWGSVRIISFYGPCECTPTSTINCDAKVPEDTIHLGRGAGLVTWVVDPENHDSLVPLGAVGELLLEGPLVGLGYLHHPERTAASFIEDPVWLLAGGAGRPGRNGRLYKTGDLVRYREDGSLVFVSRKDTQVKIRGQRIELGEIEHVLRTHAGVDDAVAVLHKDQENNSEWITAFVTVRNHADAFQGLCPLEQLERRIAGKLLPSNGGALCVTTKWDFTKWESMHDVVRSMDMKQVGGWLASLLNPMSNSGEASDLPPGLIRSEFILFSLPPAISTNTKDLAPHTGAVKFISKIIDSTPAVEKAVTVCKVAPSDLGLKCFSISSGLVLLNSIIHLFPSQAYLLNVVKEALNLEGVRTIVFGHVYSNVLYVQSLIEGAVRLFGNTISHDDIRSVTETKLDDSMLLVNPMFFIRLLDMFPGLVVHIEIIPNEITTKSKLGPLCYTAVIHVHSNNTHLQLRTIKQEEWVDFKEQGFDYQSLFNLLEKNGSSPTVPITNIPYSRLMHGERFLQLLQDGVEEATSLNGWVSHVHTAENNSLSVHDLLDLARRTGRRVEVSWALQSSHHGAIPAVFYHDRPTDGKKRIVFRVPVEIDETTSVGTLCSQPRQQYIAEKVEVELLELLRTRLSSYMVPRTIQVLDKMPLNNNCKIDRKFLERDPRSRRTRESTAAWESKSLSGPEGQVRRIWGNALRIEPMMIGPNDRFFDIGGDSISAIKVVMGARSHGLVVTVRDVFSLEVHKMAERMSSLNHS